MNFRKKRKIDMAIKIKREHIVELEEAVDALKEARGSHKMALLVLRARVRRIRSEVNELESYDRLSRDLKRELDNHYGFAV